ncbi:hypothetical protein GJ496_009701 [Pomphorhynchus laevis]|nr:hypothetical protein GJ496_009701 [Pomphorhynchus laevis]
MQRYQKKPIEYFERLLQTSNKEKNTLEKYVTLNDKYLLASYEVSYLMAKTKKPFTIGEQLLLPAAIRMSEIVHGKQYAAEISKIPLSNDTVSKRISDINNDQFQQLLMRLKDSSKLSLRNGGIGIRAATCSTDFEYSASLQICGLCLNVVGNIELIRTQEAICRQTCSERQKIEINERSELLEKQVKRLGNTGLCTRIHPRTKSGVRAASALYVLQSIVLAEFIVHIDLIE